MRLRPLSLSMTFIAGLGALVASCHSESLTCNPYRQVGVIRVAVRDAITGVPAAWDAQLTAIEHMGTLTADDTALSSSDSLHLAVGSAPGTYDLSLTKPGYATWSMNNVQVTQNPHDACHALPVNLSADLQPSP